MTRYRLTKDLLDYKAGEVFDTIDDATINLHVANDILAVYPEDYPDWFEKVKGNTGWNWRAEKGGYYYIINTTNNSYRRMVEFNSQLNDCLWEIGDCFKTSDQADEYHKYQQAIAKIMQDARDDTVNPKEADDNKFICSAVCLLNGIMCTEMISDLGGTVPLAGIYFKDRDCAVRSLNCNCREWEYIAHYDFCRKGE